MNAKFLNPFVEAAHEVLFAETGLDMVRGDLSLEKSAYVTDDVTVLLSLVGRVEGTVLYSMTQQTTMALVSRILGEPIEVFNGLAQSGIAELGNVITGRASVKLAEAGYVSTISPPTLLAGKGATISTLDFARLIVPLHGDDGAVIIHLALREGVDRGRDAAAISVPARPAHP